MPRSPTIKTYDRLFLKKLSRSQIQAHAKRNNIKANGKTEAIISQLLGKEIVAEELPAPTVGRPTRAGGRRNHINVGDAGDPQQVVEIKPEPTPSSPSISRTEHPSVSFAQQTNAPRNLSPYRRGTPYPDFGPESSSDSGTGAPTHALAPTSETQAGVPMEQTDSDVRVVRRKLTTLLNQQVSLQREIDDMNLLLEYSQRDITAATKRIEHLAWTRQAIEEVVMLDLKDDRHLWDGTGQMGAKDEEAWRQFVEDNWTGRPRWKPDLTEARSELSDSSSIASSLNSGEEDANNESQETDKSGVVDGEDEEDSIYV